MNPLPPIHTLRIVYIPDQSMAIISKLPARVTTPRHLSTTKSVGGEEEEGGERSENYDRIGRAA